MMLPELVKESHGFNRGSMSTNYVAVYYQRDQEYERYWYNEEGTLEDEIEHVEYYKTGYYRAYPMFGYSNWNWQYEDVYLESKFPEEGDEKDKKKAIDYGEKLQMART